LDDRVDLLRQLLGATQLQSLATHGSFALAAGADAGPQEPLSPPLPTTLSLSHSLTLPLTLSLSHARTHSLTLSLSHSLTLAAGADAGPHERFELFPLRSEAGYGWCRGEADFETRVSLGRCGCRTARASSSALSPPRRATRFSSHSPTLPLSHALTLSPSQPKTQTPNLES